MRISEARRRHLLDYCEKYGINIKHKGDRPDNIWHALVLWLGSRFVRGFDDNFSTTIGKTIYLSKGTEADASSYPSYLIIRHEVVHAIDYIRFGWLFLISYAIILPAWYTCRSFWEYRGYTQNALVEYELTGDIYEARFIPYMLNVFTGPDYFWMQKDKSVVGANWRGICTKIKRGEIAGLYPYSDEYNSVYSGE